MIGSLSRVTILVRDQEEALKFYTEKLGLEKRADGTFGPGIRWLAVAAKGQSEPEIVLQKPNPMIHGEEGAKALDSRIGQGTTWVFTTDDCAKTYEELQSRGVVFSSPPQQRPYGLEAIFEDLYGNAFSLVQPG